MRLRLVEYGGGWALAWCSGKAVGLKVGEHSSDREAFLAMGAVSAMKLHDTRINGAFVFFDELKAMRALRGALDRLGIILGPAWERMAKKNNFTPPKGWKS